MPEVQSKHSRQNWVLYDGECGICMTLINGFQGLFQHYRFEPLPLQTDWVKERLGYSSDEQKQELLKEMRVLTETGQVYGGADAILYIARSIWWAYPFYLVSFLPGIKPLLRKTYKEIAARRHCNSEHCTLPKH